MDNEAQSLIKRITAGIKQSVVLERESLAMLFGLALILYAFLVLGILGVVYMRNETGNEKRRLLSDGAVLVNMLAQYAGAIELSDNKTDLMRVVDFVWRGKGLHYCIISDSAGRMIVGMGDALSRHARPPGVVKRALGSDYPLEQTFFDPVAKRDIYEFSKPVFSGGVKTGVVILGLVETPDTLFSRVTVDALSVSLIAVFMLVPFFYYLFRIMLRPFRTLQAKLNEAMHSGEFSRISVQAFGEPGKIADQVNKTITTIADKYERESKAQQDLVVANRIIGYEKNRMEAMLDSLSDGIIAVNQSQEIICVNSIAEHLLHVSRESIVGKRAEACVLHETVRSFITEGSSEDDGFALRRQSVGTFTIKGQGTYRMVKMPVGTGPENTFGVLVVIKDISAQLLAEQAQSEFISSVVHEIKSPLNTIKSYTEVLMDGDVTDRETEKEFYNIITLETDRLAKIIENLLNISKIEMGSIDAKKSITKPTRIMLNCIDAVRAQAERKHISLQETVPENLSSINIDRDLMEIAVMNIMSNAVKYTPEGGKVFVSAEEQEGHMLFHIRDTGCGIAEDDQPKIFEKFFRASSKEVQDEKGTGLGLALSREILILHGGNISVNSTVGEGTLFTLTIPKETDFTKLF